MDFATLLSCIEGRWSPGIGDPTAAGWATVVAYAAAGGACLAAARRRHRDGRFWAALAVLMLALAVNKQLDLQSALTAAGRCVARAQGWYDDRRIVQALAIGAILLTAAAAFGAALWRMRRALHRIGVALLGCVVLMAFVASRAVGFHHMDALIGVTVGGVRANWAMELSGIALVGLNAAWNAARGSQAGRDRRRGRRRAGR